MQTILTTVGTSLLGNAGRALGRSPLTDHDLASYLAGEDPAKASAEMNVLHRLGQPGDRLVFLHSHTEEGRRCAEALRRHYGGLGYRTDLEEIADLSYAEGRFKQRGLRALVAALAGWIERERRQGTAVAINATGGFKAESAYATLVGLLFDVPVYYIHELFNDLIEMPAVPVSWDLSLFAEWEEFFTWIDDQPRTSAELDERWPALPSQARVLLTDEPDGGVYLSPAGEALMRAYQFTLALAAGVPVRLSPAARRTYDQADAATRARWQRTLAKLRSADLRRSMSDRVGTCDCLVFPKGRRDERVFWFEQDETVYVAELARHSDTSYERLIERGVNRRAYPLERCQPLAD